MTAPKSGVIVGAGHAGFQLAVSLNARITSWSLVLRLPNPRAPQPAKPWSSNIGSAVTPTIVQAMEQIVDAYDG